MCCRRYTLAAALTSSALFAIFGPLNEATGLTLDQLNQGTGYSYFAIAFGPLLLQPASLAFGKRPVYVASAFISCGLTLWTPFASTYGQWVANRFLLGIFGSPSFSLAEVSISDVVSRGRYDIDRYTMAESIPWQFFTHERGLPMGIYVFFLYLGATLGPLFGGFIYVGMGWKAVLVSRFSNYEAHVIIKLNVGPLVVSERRFLWDRRRLSLLLHGRVKL